LKDISSDEKRSAVSDLLQEHALLHPKSFSKSFASEYRDRDVPPTLPIRTASSEPKDLDGSASAEPIPQRVSDLDDICQCITTL